MASRQQNVCLMAVDKVDLSVALFTIFIPSGQILRIYPPLSKHQNDVQKFPLRSNFCTSRRGLHPQLCQSVFAVAKTFNTSADWQNSLRKASFPRKLRQSALRYAQCYENDTTNIDTNTSDISKSIRTK